MAMATERATIGKDVFPTRNKWLKWFEYKKEENPNEFSTTSSNLSIVTYYAPNGIENLMIFPKNNSSQLIDQRYKNASSNLNVHTVLSENYLDSELRMTNSPLVEFVSIVNRSFLSPVYEDADGSIGLRKSENSQLIYHEWNNQPKIFLNLKEDYFAKLKKEEIIPDDFTNRIWLMPDKLTGQIIAKSEISETEKNIEELLISFKNDLGFIFNINLNEGVTEGVFGDMRFITGHTNPLSVDKNSVWKTLTGENPEKPFIFPVSVSKGEEKII
jgi:hypothetical protein